jgi:hypothetical protein
MTWRWPSLLAVLVLVLSGLEVSRAQDARTAAGQGEAAGVPYPEGFRRWAHVKTGLSGSAGPGGARYAGFHHIYANAAALEGYETGRFPDGAVLVFDVFDVRTQDGNTLEGPRKFTDVMHKDSRRYAATGGWGFEEFEGPSRARVLSPEVVARCFACHERLAPSGHVISKLRE